MNSLVLVELILVDGVHAALELIACHISVRLSHAPAVYALTILISQRHGRARPLFLHNGT